MEPTNQDQNKLKADFTEKNAQNPEKGLDNWNERLDENLEPKDHNDPVADEHAKDFSEKYGSGDQSDNNSNN